MKHAVIEDSNVEVMEFFNRVGRASKNEKQATISLNQMMCWWTRKPLVVGKAMVLASLFDKVSDAEQFLGLDSPKPYDHIPDTTMFTKKLGVDPKTISILDPFAGSGNLMFPAVQLGLDVTASDYNPLAWLIEKCALEHPAKHGRNLHEDFVKYANKALEETKKTVGRYFQDSYLTYLWCWCIRCPYCSQRFPLTNHMYVVKTEKRKIGIRIIPKDKDFSTEIVDNISKEDGDKYTQKRGKAVCISCTNTIQYDVITKDITEHKDREIIVIQVQKKKGRDYVIPTEKDKKTYRDAIQHFKTKYDEFEKENLIPHENIHHDPRNPLKNYGITCWDQYFDERQMLVLCTFMKNIKKTCDGIPDEVYRKVIATYLSFILAKRIDHAGFGVIWDATRENPSPALSMRQPRLSYNFAESNPFEKIRGSISNTIKSVSKALKFTVRLQTPAVCENRSVTVACDKQYDLIITDPPYGDDVQYGELSEFFYVWAYRILSEYYDLPTRIPLDEDYCESRGRFSSKQKAKEFFGAGLKKSFRAINEKLKDDGLAVILFAHSSTEAWNQFLAAIQEARLRIVSSYAIHTEMSTNVIAQNKASFLSSIMVTCRKITGESVQYFEDLIPEIDDGVKKILDGISEQRLLTLSITDLLVMVYGKVLEVSTQHTVLKSYARDFTPDFEMLIKDARSTIIKQLVVKLLKKQPDIVGSRMAFYIINKVFNSGKVSADDALKIAQAYNTSLVELSREGVITQNKGVARLQSLKQDMYYEPEAIDPQNLHQQLCYLASHESDMAELLHHDNILENDLKPIVSLLLKNYNMKRNQGYNPTPDDNEEIRILTTMADHMGIAVEQDSHYRAKGARTKKARTRKSRGDERQSRLEKWK